MKKFAYVFCLSAILAGNVQASGFDFSQSGLAGVYYGVMQTRRQNNYDNLLTFKMQLVQRKTEVMRKRQEKILSQGRASIFAIWFILFIFIGVGWYSKMPTDMFKAMF